ncbi:hypothetical protein BU15DRAFT_62509 [Melanogaster broomeanus]|nr:hypothetical protein BU15DRAFT_62509 [Melanogaster broomeanus]
MATTLRLPVVLDLLATPGALDGTKYPVYTLDTSRRQGGIIGAFLNSDLSDEEEIARRHRFYTMNGVGNVLEGVWNRLYDGGAKAGRFGADGFQPSVALISSVRRQIYWDTKMVDTALAASFKHPDLHSASIGMVTAVSVSGVVLIPVHLVPKLIRLHPNHGHLRCAPPCPEGSEGGFLFPHIYHHGSSTKYWFSSRELRFIVSHYYPSCCGFACRASVSVNPSGGDPSEAMQNSGLVVIMFTVALHCIAWATAQEPYQRIDANLPSDSQGSQDKVDLGSIFTAFWNAWDLLLNLRGIGWNWSRGLILPKPAFEIRSRAAFVLWSALCYAFYMLAFDATVQVVRMFSPESLSSITGGSIYDPSLPPVLQLLRSFIISGVAMLMIYFGIEWYYHLLATLCVIVFQQHPSQWPPLLDSPWLSTSLSEFWGRRWHQIFRHTFLMVGGRPFNFLFGRLGGVLGVFLVSGLLHDVELHAVGRGNFIVVVGFFTMNGVGVVLERVWKRVCGRSVGGIWGRIWSFFWITLWGVPLIDAWAKAGRFGSASNFIPGVFFQKSVALVSMISKWWLLSKWLVLRCIVNETSGIWETHKINKADSDDASSDRAVALPAV